MSKEKLKIAQKNTTSKPSLSNIIFEQEGEGDSGGDSGAYGSVISSDHNSYYDTHGYGYGGGGGGG
ncbi:hypothetical protein EBU95_17395, partial [bacterium]|nr:hypothetical protein [bacterium]